MGDTQINVGLDFHRMHVFMLDDQDHFIKMMKNNLVHLGFSSVTSAGSVEAAKRICLKQDFDIYLIDYNLGDGPNGRQFIHYLHQKGRIPQDSPVLMVTGDASRAMVLSAIEEEPDDYLIKPFSILQFRQRICRVLARKRDLSDVYHALHEKRYQDVISKCHEHISRLSPYSAEIRTLLCEVCIKTGALQDGKAVIEEGLAFHESARFRLELGKICCQLGEYEEALENLNLAKQMKPYLMEIYRTECSTYIQMKDYARASKALEDAINISPQSSTMLNMQIDLAASEHNYLKMRDSISALMNLHRFEPDRLPDLMSAYVHSAILFASQSSEPYHLDMLSKNINSVIRRYAEYVSAGSNDFDLEVFQTIVKSRIDVTTGEVLRGKKSLYKTINSLRDSIKTVPESVFSNILMGLTQIGDYEYADNIQKEREQTSSGRSVDPILSTCTAIYSSDENLRQKQEKYRSVNRMGIAEYKQGNYEKALELFDEALRKSPCNTVAIINKAQSLIKLIQAPNLSKNQKTVYINSCRDILGSIDGLVLSREQDAYVADIKFNLSEVVSSTGGKK